jgi:broad specificity phosphatase PhoE
MSVEITFVRHGETEANAAGVWQGTSDSPLSGPGRRQVTLLGERLRSRTFEVVVTSGLGRARSSVEAVAAAEVDDRWRELHLGSWEGLTQEQITERDPDTAAALGSGRDVAFGGGERVSEMIERLSEAYGDLIGRLDDGDRALVVSHGGALLTLFSVLLGTDTRGRVLRLTNTGLTTFRHSDAGGDQMVAFNDSSHLPGAPVRADEGVTHIVAARHGETIANVQRRWQGQTGGELTERGREQARRLATVFPEVDILYTSPLARARDTAAFVADRHRLDPIDHPDLRELGFGSWETRTADEIAAEDPAGWAALMNGEDVARGGNGETFAQLQDRVEAAVTSLAGRHRGKAVGVVSHGAATRALATRVVGLDFAKRRRIAQLSNAALARFVHGDRGPALAAWNVRSHLEDAW